MGDPTRRRLATLVRARDPDVAEAGLLVSALADASVDVAADLLRVDAVADTVRTQRGTSDDPIASASVLAAVLGEDLGFSGDRAHYHDPRNSLLHEVLRRRTGMPITLSMLYVAVARRAGIPAFGVGLPGHYVMAVAGRERAIVLDPFDRGAQRSEAELADLVAASTHGRTRFNRAMVRPTPVAATIRRVLDNLTRDYVRASDPAGALWTIEAKLVLPDPPASDLRLHGEMLMAVGRFGQAAASFEAYVSAAPDASDRDTVAARAIGARANLN